MSGDHTRDEGIPTDATLPGFVAWLCQRPHDLDAVWRRVRDGELHLGPGTTAA